MKWFFSFLVLAMLANNALAANECKVLVVVGMEDERAIATGDGVEVVVGSANAKRLRERLGKIDISGVAAVYSFGVAGGLDPTLKAGNLLVSTQVLAQSSNAESHIVEESWMADKNLLMAIQMRAAKEKNLNIRKGIFLGTDIEARDNLVPANSENGNNILRDLSGADIIDNESHIAAKFASEHNLPFVSIRAVSDSVYHALPPAALIAFDEDGSPNGSAIAKSILINPLQIPALIRTAWQYHKALNALQAYRSTVGFSALSTCR